MSSRDAAKRKHLKRRLRKAGYSEGSEVWDNALGLMPEWQQTLGELVEAAIALAK